jgi:fibronectin type 3 domain-containing protein
MKKVILFIFLIPAMAYGQFQTSQNFSINVLHNVVLTWTASTSSGVVGYNIYRGAASGGEGLYQSLGTVTTWIDDNNGAGYTIGQTYYYYVTAVCNNGKESMPSNETSATIPSS